MGEPLRVLGYVVQRPGEPSYFLHPDDLSGRRPYEVPLVDGNAAEAERARLVALLRRAKGSVEHCVRLYETDNETRLLADLEQELAKYE